MWRGGGVLEPAAQMTRRSRRPPRDSTSLALGYEIESEQISVIVISRASADGDEGGGHALGTNDGPPLRTRLRLPTACISISPSSTQVIVDPGVRTSLPNAPGQIRLVVDIQHRALPQSALQDLRTRLHDGELPKIRERHPSNLGRCVPRGAVTYRQ